MLRLLSFLLLLSTPAWAAWPDDPYKDQTSTDSGPSGATDGLLLFSSGSPVRGFAVAACADSGQTLSGAGYLRAWVYVPVIGVWMRNPDLDIPVTVSGGRCQSSSDFRVGYLKNRRVYFATSGVTVSSGGVRVWILLDTTT